MGIEINVGRPPSSNSSDLRDLFPIVGSLQERMRRLPPKWPLSASMVGSAGGVTRLIRTLKAAKGDMGLTEL
jgi:hypothetical protein